MGTCCISKRVKQKIIVIQQPKESYNINISECMYDRDQLIKKDLTNQEIATIRNVAACSRQQTSIPENINPLITRPKSALETTRIKLAICKSNFLKELSRSSIDILMSSMKLLQVKSRDVITSQNSLGDRYYVLTAGRLQIYADDIENKVLNPGDGFGELELLHDIPRTCKVIAVDNAEVWVLEKKDLVKEVKNKKGKETEIEEIVNKVELFGSLNEEQKLQLGKKTVLMSFEENSVIFSEFESGSVLYIILEGTVMVTVKGQAKRTMHSGDFFGEQAILYNTRRTATVTAQSKTLCLTISKQSLNDCIGVSFDKIIKRNCIKISLERSNTLKRLAKYQILLLIDSFEISSYIEGSVVIYYGNNLCDKLYVILKGEVSYKGVKYEPFSILGDEYIISTAVCPSLENITTSCDTEIAELTRFQLYNILGSEISSLFLSNKLLKVIQKVALLQNISSKKLRLLTSQLRIMEYSNGEEIVTQGTEAQEFFIVKQGNVEIYKDEVYIRTIGKHDYFGERSLMLKEIRSATAKAKGEVSCWVLHKENFSSIIQNTKQAVLSERLILQDDTVSLDDLLYIKHLGQGQFGNVYLTTHKDKFTVYALKTVSKKIVDKFQCYDLLNLERKILLQLDHPFIVKLVKTFKDDFRVYFLLEHVRGLDLFNTLHKMSLLSDNQAQFYASCLLLIIEHLHERNIIHRDLKPENVMIDQDGYPKLIDFGAANIVMDRTSTMVGTPHYMAPEIILGIGYNTTVDLWSLGIMIYEFVFGKLPFGDNLKNPQEVYSIILSNKPLSYPNAIPKSNALVQIVEQLLNRNPSQRNGNLKNAPFFQSIDFGRLLNKKYKAPFIHKLTDLHRSVADAQRKQIKIQQVMGTEDRVDRVLGKVKAKSKPNWDSKF